MGQQVLYLLFARARLDTARFSCLSYTRPGHTIGRIGGINATHEEQGDSRCRRSGKTWSRSSASCRRPDAMLAAGKTIGQAYQSLVPKPGDQQADLSPLVSPVRRDDCSLEVDPPNGDASIHCCWTTSATSGVRSARQSEARQHEVQQTWKCHHNGDLQFHGNQRTA